jgi:hypothetical protein|tara:strand:+ start:56 stop:199 length:144 start_codon:yes stop_codon:yes gene_type:complete
MTLQAGIGLFFLGMTITIIGLFIAYYFASKKPKEIEVPNPLRDLFKK